MTWWPVLVVAGPLAVSYVLALRARPASLPRWPRHRAWAWGVGCALVAVALSPPMTDASLADHRVHMVQHLLVGMYAPLALVVGAPVALALGSASRDAARRTARALRSTPVRILSHPVTAAALSTGGLFVVYLSPAHAVLTSHRGLLLLTLVHLLASGTLLVWAVAAPAPAPHRARLVTRTTVLVVSAGLHAFLATLLYARAAEGTADEHTDHEHGSAHAHHLVDTAQQTAELTQAAQIMYYGGDLAELGLATLLVVGWYRRSRHTSADADRAGLAA